MYRLLIFGGTTEGRLLAEFCAENRICCDVSVATDYGASLLPGSVNVHIGRLDCKQMSSYIRHGNYSAVADATHPYAAEASRNIRKACETTNTQYIRLLRDTSMIYGDTAENMQQLIGMINDSESVILSALGSKSAEDLTRVHRYRDRIWLRLLPSDGIPELCRNLGYDEKKIICGKGPFTTEQNIRHIALSHAEILLTKESGAAGGYPEKIEAARKCGIKVINLIRPRECGIGLDEMKKRLSVRQEEC